MRKSIPSMLSEYPFLKNQHDGNSHTDTGISKIKNRLKKFEIFTSQPGNPFGILPAHEWKIKHVNHSAEHKRGIATLGR